MSKVARRKQAAWGADSTEFAPPLLSKKGMAQLLERIAYSRDNMLKIKQALIQAKTKKQMTGEEA